MSVAHGMRPFAAFSIEARARIAGVPRCVLASDQVCRVADLAIDYCAMQHRCGQPKNPV